MTAANPKQYGGRGVKCYTKTDSGGMGNLYSLKKKASINSLNPIEESKISCNVYVKSGYESPLKKRLRQLMNKQKIENTLAKPLFVSNMISTLKPK